mmetsp:Transcript_48832/g.142332  ORF Transcript_48832/g.142332 Transcript_48832/m.142332 type:complete len:309 (+) Transcript_48832:230-1156(+)
MHHTRGAAHAPHLRAWLLRPHGGPAPLLRGDGPRGATEPLRRTARAVPAVRRRLLPPLRRVRGAHGGGRADRAGAPVRGLEWGRLGALARLGSRLLRQGRGLRALRDRGGLRLGGAVDRRLLGELPIRIRGPAGELLLLRGKGRRRTDRKGLEPLPGEARREWEATFGQQSPLCGGVPVQRMGQVDGQLRLAAEGHIEVRDPGRHPLGALRRDLGSARRVRRTGVALGQKESQGVLAGEPPGASSQRSGRPQGEPRRVLQGPVCPEARQMRGRTPTLCQRLQGDGEILQLHVHAPSGRGAPRLCIWRG